MTWKASTDLRLKSPVATIYSPERLTTSGLCFTCSLQRS
nr:MAG TPA: outer capsid protein sigma-1 attachment protein [Caudoviricetes sp.]